MLGKMLADGMLQWKADIVPGLRNAPEALLRLFDGRNDGKLLVKIDDDLAKL